jgi:type IV secretion system protein VirB6
MKVEKLILLLVLVIVAIIVMIVLWIYALIGAVDITNGCLYRYSFNKANNTLAKSSSILSSVILKANGNYNAVSSGTNSGLDLDPNSYGKWVNTGVKVKGDQKIDLAVKGEVSLCKAYIPQYNLQQHSNLDKDGKLVAIPRVEDKASEPVNLIFDARVDEWRNLAQVFKNDHIVVALHPDKKTTVGNSSVYNNFEKRVETADCTEGKRGYSPICGRYSIWNSNSSYTDNCEYVAECYQCNQRLVCRGWNIFNIICLLGWETQWDWCSCYRNVMASAPAPYRNDGKYTSPWRNDINALFTNLVPDCGTNRSYVEGDWQNQKYFWFSADTATGLLYRYDTSEYPTNMHNRGSNFGFSQISPDQTNLSAGADYRIIRDEIYNASNVAYLQYRTHDVDGGFADNTGGYVLNIKHTKCRRKNGSMISDVFTDRGSVQYVIADGKDPNKDSLTATSILLDANGEGSITASTSTKGILWLRINNHPNDYKDSFGQYKVDFFTSVDQFEFYKDILDPFFQGFKGKIQGAAERIFKNITCYKDTSGNCTNFFNYVKGLLSLYIMLYGMMFLVGMVQISQTDLVIRVVKIAFVAGLLNGQTFEFFNEYVFGFITGFTDDIIANMSGYSMFSGSTTISNPFMFLNELLTKVFLSSTFIAQILALLSMGINGAIYFILIMVCLGIAVIVLLRSIAVYLMAFMAITVLIAIAPIFLVFILFERTFYLFDNWVKFTFRYMIEPIILLGGIIILTQLFTIYLDYVIGYSVCWKCIMPVKIPFPNISGISPAFLDVDLFCIEWFAPWGFDNRGGQMGLDMQNMIVLIMIAYCMWGYIDFSGNIVARLAGSVGGPSATGMGRGMAGAIEEKALSQVGLDRKSRGKIQGAIKERLQTMQSADKNMPIDQGNRHDIKPPSGNESGKGGGSGSRDDSKAQNSNKDTGGNISDGGTGSSESLSESNSSSNISSGNDSGSEIKSSSSNSGGSASIGSSSSNSDGGGAKNIQSKVGGVSSRSSISGSDDKQGEAKNQQSSESGDDKKKTGFGSIKPSSDTSGKRNLRNSDPKQQATENSNAEKVKSESQGKKSTINRSGIKSEPKKSVSSKASGGSDSEGDK